MSDDQIRVLEFICYRIIEHARSLGCVQPIFLENPDDHDMILIVDAETGARYRILLERIE